MILRNIIVLVFCASISVVLVRCASTTPNDDPTTTTKTTESPEPSVPCKVLDGCDKCLKNVTCYWCESTKVCDEYPVGDIFPKKEDCPLSSARWLECWLNFEALLISMGVIAGVILISCSCCCVYCCCCKGSNKRKYAKEDAKLERQKEERKMRQEERRAERKAKNDEIRKKYGLVKDDSGYTRFENS
ncbi:pituitary tumor-transforming gene 1 protein-interacting protein-like [Glandiceps talaboti]